MGENTGVPPDGFDAEGALSRGAFSDVFVVRRGAERGVCKRLGLRAREDVAAWVRLEREGRIVRALRGRGAPALWAAGIDAAGPFVVTRRIEMPTLGAMEAASVGRATVDAAFAALAAVHEADDADAGLRIVHGDVTPTNVLVAEDAAAACFVDFGLATMRGEAEEEGGAFRGTMAFAAPELARGEAIDVRADLFALAVSLLAVAAGEGPRSVSSEAALLALAGSESIEGWARDVAVRRGLGAGIVACVAFDRDGRPGRARDVCGT